MCPETYYVPRNIRSGNSCLETCLVLRLASEDYKCRKTRVLWKAATAKASSVKGNTAVKPAPCIKVPV